MSVSSVPDNYGPDNVTYQINRRIDDLKNYMGEQINSIDKRLSDNQKLLEEKVDKLNDNVVAFMATEVKKERTYQHGSDFIIKIITALSTLAVICSVVLPIIVK